MRKKKRDPQKEELQRSITLLRKKQNELSCLQQEHSRLRFEHDLLVSLCDTCDWIRHRQQSAGESEQQAPHSLAAEPQMAAASELLLLEQLRNIPYSLQPDGALPGSLPQVCLADTPGLEATAAEDPKLAGTTVAQAGCSGATATAHSSGLCGNSSSSDATNASIELEQVAPKGDALLLVRQILAEPAVPGAESMKLRDLAQYSAQMVREVSLLLHHHTVGSSQLYAPDDPQRPDTKLRAIIVQHLRLLATLCMHNRLDLASSMALVNHDTGCEVLMKEPCKHSHRLAVRHINLTQQQVQHIVAGTAVFTRIQTPVLAELRQLQEEAAVAGGSSGSSAGDINNMHAFLAYSEQQQAKVERLNVLLRKHTLITLSAGAYLWGRLTWLQVAQLIVMMSPYLPHLYAFTECVAEMLQEQKAQEKQTP